MEDSRLDFELTRLAWLGRDRCGVGYGKYPLGILEALETLVPLLSAPSDGLTSAVAAFKGRLSRD